MTSSYLKPTGARAMDSALAILSLRLSHRLCHASSPFRWHSLSKKAHLQTLWKQFSQVSRKPPSRAKSPPKIAWKAGWGAGNGVQARVAFLEHEGIWMWECHEQGAKGRAETLSLKALCACFPRLVIYHETALHNSFAIHSSQK